MSKRERTSSLEEKRREMQKTSYSWVFPSCDIVLVTNLSLRKFVGFSSLWFTRGKSLCLVYLAVLVILLVKDPNQD